MANDLIPFKEDAERVTCTPSTNVVGKTCVSISGDRNADGSYTIAPATAGGKIFGIACWDALVGQKVTVITVTSGCIVPVTTSGVVTAGQSVKPAAGGTVIAATALDRSIGIVLNGAASAADAIIQLAHHTA